MAPERKTESVPESISVSLEADYSKGYRDAIHDMSMLIFTLAFTTIVLYRLTSTEF